MTHASAVAAESEQGATARTRHELRGNAPRQPVLITLCALLCALHVATRASAEDCPDWHAVFVSTSGVVELRATEGGPWRAAEAGTVVCNGALIRVSPFGNATLRLDDGSLFKLDANSSLRVSASQTDSTVIDIIRGIIHVISRDPRFLRFNTPYANAGLEGTEFDIEVTTDETLVTVIEGEVVLRNPAGEVYVSSGRRGSARGSQRPRLVEAEDRFERAAWTPYFVPLLDGALPAPDAVSRSSPPPGFFARRAAARLRVGRPDAASADLGLALARDPSLAEALALRALVALVRGETAEASQSAERAVALGPDEAAPLLALSYVQQARLEQHRAAESAERAVMLEPSNPIAWARVAELRLETDEFFAALGAANRALELDPTLGPAQTVLGFALLMQTDAEQAETLFRQAIASDPASPLPYLGLGLALIRQGDLERGREAIETAVILDPRNAMTRSYMARVYGAERRSALEGTQLDLARLLAPEDPTSYYYETLRRQSANRPVEALRSLRTAAELNRGRPVFRSTLGLDEDLAARSAGIGPLHRALGFEQLAINAGLASVAADPSDHSGHRLVADVYSALPRHQIARVNELFLSQLLQPINVTPIQAQLAEPNRFILDNAGPSELAYTEFGPSLSRNGLAWQLSGVRAANGTRGTDFTVAGLERRFSYSAGYFDFETDGFRQNNDFEQRVANLFLQYRVSPDTTLLGELRSNRARQGDLALLFDRSRFSPVLRQEQNVDTARFGLRHDLASDSTLLGAVIYEGSDVGVEVPTTFTQSLRSSSYSLDFRHILGVAGGTLHSGAQVYRQRTHSATRQRVPLPAPPFEFELENVLGTAASWASVYAYYDRPVGDRLTVSVGVSAERLRDGGQQREQLDPKLGLTWAPTPRTTVRAGSFRILQGPLVSKRSIQPRLEPTHVGGFNQYFFGARGDEAWRHGIRVDHALSDALFAGAEVTVRSIDRLSEAVSPDGAPMLLDQTIDEAFHRAYVYWAPRPSWSLSAEYRHETIDGNGLAVPEGYTRIRTRRLPIRLNWFHRNGLSSRLEANYVDQSGNFSPMTFGAPDTAFAGEDNFWVYNFAVSYRLPARHGVLSLKADNLLDESFRFQDVDPENPSIVPERMISLRFSLSY